MSASAPPFASAWEPIVPPRSDPPAQAAPPPPPPAMPMPVPSPPAPVHFVWPHAPPVQAPAPVASATLLQDLNNLLANTENYIVRHVSDLMRNTQLHTSKVIRDAQPPAPNNVLSITGIVLSGASLLLLCVLFFWLAAKFRSILQFRPEL